MTAPPVRPMIYHITHIDNLPSIVATGGLLSDARMIAQGGPTAAIGMSTIKKRRLRLSVSCHRDDRVGDYVPFYLCPRSIMLYVIHRANHPDLTYRGGQDPIVHLESDLYAVVAWAQRANRRWAFSLSNAGATYAEYRSSLGELSQVHWEAVAARDFRPPDIREHKQAEFLVHGSFPWYLISRIGVRSRQMKSQVLTAIVGAIHRPRVEVLPEWYY